MNSEEVAPTVGDEHRRELERDLVVSAGERRLPGTLFIPHRPIGIVLFAHGSGSSRHSPRNRYVASVLHGSGVATLLFDLLTPGEEEIDRETTRLRFDIRLLADRLAQATDWVAQEAETRDLSQGYFGASTGGAAALVAASERPDVIRAVVSRGGRPDLAGPALPLVRAPTLLIVGGNDLPVIEMNRDAQRRMRAPSRLEIVPGATHLFEERGALERVAHLARDWFQSYLPLGREQPGVEAGE